MGGDVALPFQPDAKPASVPWLNTKQQSHAKIAAIMKLLAYILLRMEAPHTKRV